MGQRDFSRAQRVGDGIQRELAALLLRSVADPRVEGVTISGVEMSPDLRLARIFVTPPVGSDVAAVMAALNHAAGFLRGRLGATLRLRSVPRLTFTYDPTLDRAERVDALIAAGLPASGARDGDD